MVQKKQSRLFPTALRIYLQIPLRVSPEIPHQLGLAADVTAVCIWHTVVKTCVDEENEGMVQTYYCRPRVLRTYVTSDIFRFLCILLYVRTYMYEHNCELYFILVKNERIEGGHRMLLIEKKRQPIAG